MQIHSCLGADGNCDHGGAGAGHFWPSLHSDLAHAFHSKPLEWAWLLTPFPDSDLSGLCTQAQACTCAQTHSDTPQQALLPMLSVFQAQHLPLHHGLPQLLVAAASLSWHSSPRCTQHWSAARRGYPHPHSHLPTFPPSCVPMAW